MCKGHGQKSILYFCPAAYIRPERDSIPLSKSKQEGILKGGKHGPVPTYLRGAVLRIAVLFFYYYNRVGHECTILLGFDCYLRAQTQSPSYDALKEEKKSLWSTRKGKAYSSAWKYFLFKGTNEEQQI